MESLGHKSYSILHSVQNAMVQMHEFYIHTLLHHFSITLYSHVHVIKGAFRYMNIVMKMKIVCIFSDCAKLVVICLRVGTLVWQVFLEIVGFSYNCRNRFNVKV